MVVAMAVVPAAALWFVASSQGGDSDRRLPVGGGRVTKGLAWQTTHGSSQVHQEAHARS
jgi:hypothetical protein